MFESLSIFFSSFYSLPIMIYSVPFTIFLTLMLLSVIGLPFDIDLECGEGSSFNGVFSHFNITRIPLNLLMMFFFLITSVLSVIFSELISDKWYFVSIFMFVIIYPVLWMVVIPLSHLSVILDNTLDIHAVNYEGIIVEVLSSKVDLDFGYASSVQNGFENQINIYSDDENIKLGDQVVIIMYNEEKERYLVKKFDN